MFLVGIEWNAYTYTSSAVAITLEYTNEYKLRRLANGDKLRTQTWMESKSTQFSITLLYITILNEND